jgi:hypothetical protein
MDLFIDPEFRDLLPEHEPDEIAQLEKNIADEGRVRNPLVYWHNDGKNLIIDGMHRYEIAERLGVPYRTEPMIFESRAHVKAWIIDNAIGQRNIPDKQTLRIMRGKLFAANVEANELPIPLMQNAQKSDTPAKKRKGKAAIAVEVAKATGVSPATVRRDAKFAEAVESLAPPVKKQLKSGKVKATDAEVKALAKLPEDKQKDAVAALQNGVHESLKDAIDDQKEKPNPWDNIAPGLAEQVKEAAISKAEVARLSEFNMDQQREIMKLIPDTCPTIAQAIADYESGPDAPKPTERQQKAAEYKTHLDGIKATCDRYIAVIDNIREFLQKTGGDDQIRLGDELLKGMSDARSAAAKLARTMK